MNKTNLKKIAMKDVAISISEDLGNGDITTNLLGKDKNNPSTAFVRSNEDAIFSWKSLHSRQNFSPKLIPDISKKQTGIFDIFKELNRKT